MKWADHCISKLSLNDSGFIDSVTVYDDFGNSLSRPYQKDRPWMVQQVRLGKTFCTMKRNSEGTWATLGSVKYDGEIFTWMKVPKNLSRRKAFLSFYHHDDEEYRESFDNLFCDLVVSKSVNDGDISSDTSDDYIKHLIQDGHLTDSSVVIVLIGPKTKCRKHVDWEISGALNYKVGDRYSALLGLMLPGHPNFGSKVYSPNLLPARFSDNLKSKYAVIRDWTEDRVLLQLYLELAVTQRDASNAQRDNSRLQMKYNTCS